MNYARVYRQFIATRLTLQVGLTVYETHHILPKACGGGNEETNLIRLPPEEHLFAHILLAKIHGGLMSHCVVRMLGMKKYSGRTSRLEYRAFRDEHRRIASLPKSSAHRKAIGDAHRGMKRPEGFGEKISLAKRESYKNNPESREKIRQARLGTHLTDEQRKKRSRVMQEVMKTEAYKKALSEGMKPVFASTEYREKIGAASRKIWSSTKFRTKMSEVHTGRVHSEQTRKLIGDSQRGVKCPQRGRLGSKKPWQSADNAMMRIVKAIGYAF